MFTGRRYDVESGLYYYRARMYNPALGRFMQTDPIGYYDTMNPYQYCGNNPVNWIDPWGLFRFGYRSLQGDHPYVKFASWFLFFPYGRPAANHFNVDLYHEADFYDDGPGEYTDMNPGTHNSEGRSSYRGEWNSNLFAYKQ